MWRASLLLVLAALGGCSSYSAPRLAVTNAQVAGVTDDGVVLEFTLDATNANEVEIPLREVEYSVTLDGREVFRGVRSPEATLRRYGTQRIILPAAIPAGSWEALAGGVAAFRIDGTLGYTTPGEIAQVLFDTGVRRPSVGFSQVAQVNLEEPQTPPGTP